jgi:hypothetical protein
MLTSDEEDVGSILTDRAAQMNNNSPLALVCDGLAKVWNGDLQNAEARFRRAVELISGEPTVRFAYQGLGKVAVTREDWKSALYWGQITYSVSPSLSGGHLQRISASAMFVLGRFDAKDFRRSLRVKLVSISRPPRGYKIVGCACVRDQRGARYRWRVDSVGDRGAM